MDYLNKLLVFVVNKKDNVFVFCVLLYASIASSSPLFDDSRYCSAYCTNVFAFAFNISIAYTQLITIHTHITFSEYLTNKDLRW